MNNDHYNKVKLSEKERALLYDFWFNSNQTMKQLGEKYNVSGHVASHIVSKFLRIKDVERQKILKEYSITLQSKMNQNDP